MADDVQRSRVRQILVDSELYFSPFNDLNDPFEGRILPDYRASNERVREFWMARRHATEGLDAEPRDQRLDELAREAAGTGPYSLHSERMELFLCDFGVCSLVSACQDLPMWAYYGDGHKGVCLRFRFSEALLNFAFGDQADRRPRGLLIPIQYEAVYPRVSFYDGTEGNLITSLLGTKAKDWEHEQEWRLLRWGAPGRYRFPAELLDGVVVGERIEEDNLNLIRGWIRERPVDTQLLQARSSRSEFKLELVEL